MLQNKVVLVTGGSSGIGKAIAKRLAREGATIAIVASSQISKANEAAKEIIAEGGKAKGYVADVRDSSEVTKLVAAVNEQHGSIDILVNSAGIFLPTPIGESDIATFDQMIDVNIRSTFYCINAVTPIMKANGGGAIVCLASVAATLGIAEFSTYCATKAAVSMMVKSLALELAPLNININAICPGNTATPMNEAMRTDASQKELLDSLSKATPSQRIFSQPEDIAELALFLASPSGKAMHGSSVLMDEGLSAGISF